MVQSHAKLTLLTTLFLSMAACSPKTFETGNSPADLQAQGDAIIGGVALPQEHPVSKNVVAIFDNLTKGLCTGSLYKDNLIITAAHCIPEDKSQLFVFFGTDIKNAKTAADLQLRKVDKAEISPYYASRKKATRDQGDIALVHFEGALPAGYSQSTLLSDTKLLLKDTPVVLAGYGIDNGKLKTGSFVLRATFVSIAKPDFALTEVLLDQTQGRGACHGDSGGPAYVYNKVSKTYLLWGITSRGDNDLNDDCSQYSVYTNILAYSTWLREASKRLTTSVRDLVPKQ